MGMAKRTPEQPTTCKTTTAQVHEDVLVFGRTTYRPQGVVEIPESDRKVHNPEKNTLGHCSRKPYVQTHTNYPKSIITFKSERGVHPTQKPVALMEYMIRTYTNDGDVVMDNTMGSGTTGVACMNTGRRFIGIERDEGYFKIAQDRINAAMPIPEWLK